MSKDKKARELNEEETKNVSGGYVSGNWFKGYSVYDDDTNELIDKSNDKKFAEVLDKGNKNIKKAREDLENLFKF